MSPRLYDLVADMKEAERQLYDMDVDPEIIADTLESLEMPIEEKLKNYASLYKNLLSDVAAFKAEEKRLAERRKAMENKADWLKNEMDAAMTLADMKELKDGVHEIKYRKGSEVVEIDEKQLPRDYWIAQNPKPMSKTEIKKFFKEGREIPGVSLVRKPDSIQIK